jgi:hypothetical protein
MASRPPHQQARQVTRADLGATMDAATKAAPPVQNTGPKALTPTPPSHRYPRRLPRMLITILIILAIIVLILFIVGR